MKKSIAIGASLGGPRALREILPQICRTNSCPIFITQHIVLRSIECFRSSLVPLVGDYTVKVGESLDIVEEKTIYLYPGFGHMRVMHKGDEVMINIFENGRMAHSIDALFDSVASVYRDASRVLVLSGMGIDGVKGAEEVKRAGGEVVVQDMESSLVWSMPSAVAGLGLADMILSLESIVKYLAPKKGQKGMV